MSQPRSAGVLLYRRREKGTEVLLILPGGPFWRRRNEGAWQIPKGALEPGESPVDAAMRELHEELGVLLEEAPRPLCTVRQAGGKRVEAFAAERDWDVADLVSNEISIEWPPRSGQIMRVPEVGEARWMNLEEAETAMLASQRPVLTALRSLLAQDSGGESRLAGRGGKSP
ncbi:NUDIX domain-containing protein [Sphingomonas sp.]|uniref:NUDIX domain-containing protein n=1 Tax=Sphingomonas sp. TaxID=28214 RepID=UPI000DB0971D|nr:NUDIX domain-containing protein [Sphingomonas sp.]PZU08732.1 MAG: NUDIX hydrolase [Sphingomonas sp.]